MNILVVEDETEVRAGVLALLQEGYVSTSIYEADNGTKALNILEQNPIDIVLTDIRMPEMNGLQLLEFIRKRFPAIAVILISAYPDFSFVQKALSLGAFDYLLKPVGARQIEQVLNKAIGAIHMENRKRHNLEHNKRIVMQNALRNMVNGVPVDYLNYELQCELEQTGFLFLHVTAERTNGAPCDALFWYSVQNMFEEIFLPDLAAKPCFVSTPAGLFAVLPLPFGTNIPPISANVEKLRRETYAVLHSELHIVQGPPYDSLFDLPDAYRSYLESLQMSAVKGRTGMLVFVSVALKNLDAVGCVKLMSEALLRPEISIEQCRETVSEVTIWLSKETDALETSAKIRIKRAMPDAKTLENAGSKKEILQLFGDWVECWVENLSNQARMERHYAIRKIAAFVRDRLNGKISLKDAADHTFMNKSYLSTLFKNETGVTFSEYVLGQRMSKAAALLKDTDLPITDVAAAVGYPNFGYFGQVFRKVFGCSPSRFRKVRMHTMPGKADE